jgi:RNA polymerase sigma-70 factor (ECF subfamily)
LKVLIETRLIRECKDGNLSNFRKVVEITAPFIFSVAFRMLGDEDMAKDIVQETMIAVWQKLRSIRTPETYKTWVYRIAINRCYDVIRKVKIRPEIHQDEKAWEVLSNHLVDGSVSELENEENAMVVNMLTNSLSSKQKAVFILAEIEELPYDEIAVITGMKKQSVKANLYYARKNIENKIKKMPLL